MRWKHRQDAGGFPLPTDLNADTPEVDAFIEEVIAVCKKHGFSISHEDGHGAFEIERFSDDNSAWLRAAIDKTEVT